MAEKLTGPEKRMLEMILRRRKPVDTTTLCQQYGCRRDTAGDVLRSLRAKGLIASFRETANDEYKWASPAVAAPFIAAIGHAHKESARRELLMARERYVRRRERLKAEREDEERQEAWLIPVQRVVPAAECPPISNAGPNSVFALAKAKERRQRA